MDPKTLRRRNTIVEEAADSLIQTGEKIEELNKHKKKSFLQSLKDIKKDIYNSEYREFLSRDSKSWFKLSVFYSLFYGVLAGFFMLCLMVFYYTIDHKRPTYFNQESVMNFRSVNPGLGFRPHINPENDLIFLNTSNWKPTYEFLNLFLREYENAQNKSFIAAHGKSQTFDVSSIISNTPCAKSKHYGMSSGTPCVVVKLNRIYGWLPYTNNQVKTPVNLTKLKSNEKFVYVACEGEYDYDKENLGPIEYFSSYPNNEIGGINFKYFPYRNQPNYLSPLVFVHFKNATKNVQINVLCRAYAKNIDNTDRLNRRGMVKFQLNIGK
ncbi:unnamed protein product [Brachionus calyciflorus]|uniref:Sodium/potassium-transporting ATPase subunit beta-2 n=1 Tax=Brachionus calyciflorus TaxID=104777 RepID=A0A814GK19_9BILA|nr:unnamed protein product [Brachionus calyciflorus]